MEELLDIEPPEEEEMCHLQWDPRVLDLPYQKDNGQTDSARVFSRRLRNLGLRAGYSRPPTIHDFRAEGLHLIGMCSLFTTSCEVFYLVDELADKLIVSTPPKTLEQTAEAATLATRYEVLLTIGSAP